jgi:hypothetical protein
VVVRHLSDLVPDRNTDGTIPGAIGLVAEHGSIVELS